MGHDELPRRCCSSGNTPGCGKIKPAGEFHRHYDGRLKTCKSCLNARRNSLRGAGAADDGTNAVVVTGSKRCGAVAVASGGQGKQGKRGCGKVKPLSAFYVRTEGKANGRRSNICKTCTSIERAARRETDAYKLWLRDYRSRPETKAREKESIQRRETKAWEYRHEYNRRPRTRILSCRHRAKEQLAKRPGRKREDELNALIRAYDAELERLALR